MGTGTVPKVVAVTDPRLAIVRFHGRNAQTWYVKATTTAQRFDYLYSQEELAEWLPAIRDVLAPGAAEVHLLMNNNRANYAVRNALDLMELLGLPTPPRDERGVPAPRSAQAHGTVAAVLGCRLLSHSCNRSGSCSAKWSGAVQGDPLE